MCRTERRKPRRPRTGPGTVGVGSRGLDGSAFEQEEEDAAEDTEEQARQARARAAEYDTKGRWRK